MSDCNGKLQVLINFISLKVLFWEHATAKYHDNIPGLGFESRVSTYCNWLLQDKTCKVTQC